MKNKLFSNLERLTSIFAIAVAVITVVVLILRLTVFNPKIEKKPAATDPAQATAPEDIVFDYDILDHLVFKDFKSTINPYIRNLASNTNNMQVKIINDKSHRVMYESSYLRPGVNEATMTLIGDELAAGVYDCSAEIYVLNAENIEVTKYTEKIVIEIENNLEGTEEDPLLEGEDATKTA